MNNDRFMAALAVTACLVLPNLASAAGAATMSKGTVMGPTTVAPGVRAAGIGPALTTDDQIVRLQTELDNQRAEMNAMRTRQASDIVSLQQQLTAAKAQADTAMTTVRSSRRAWTRCDWPSRTTTTISRGRWRPCRS